MASIKTYETSSGTRYRVQYRKPDGKTTSKRGFKRKLDAQRWATEKESSKNHGEFVEESAGMVTLAKLCDPWLSKKKVALKPSSYAPLESSMRNHVKPKWGDIQVRNISHGDVQEWVSGMSGKSGATVVIRAYGILAGLLDDAVSDRLIARNPARGIALPRKQRRDHIYLSAEQLYKFAGCCISKPHRKPVSADYEHSTLILLLGIVGLRWGEAVGLRIGDVDFDSHRINVKRSATQIGNEIFEGTPKNGRGRKVVFAKALDEPLHALIGERKDDELLFTGGIDGHLQRPDTRVHSWFVGARERAGLPHMTVHDLRHTAASLMVRSGANVKAVQRQLGHSSAAMTLDVYADLFDDDLDAVGDAMDTILLRYAVKMQPKGMGEAA
jgi:integrase